MALTQLSELNHIPGDTGLPVVGSLFNMLRQGGRYYEGQRDKYGDVFKSHTLFGTSVVLTGPAANKLILVEESKFTSNQEAWEMALSDLFPNGLMLMDGERHQHHRSIMHEAFKKDPMQGYLDIMPAIISNTLDELDGKNRLVFFPFLKKLTLRLAAEVFFGISEADQLGKLNKAITDIVDAALAIPIHLPFTKYGKGIAGRKYLVTYFRSVIQDRRKTPGKDLFSRLCLATNEEGASFSDQEIIDHLIFVLMAAHDTTAITLTMMSYFMAKYPKWQSAIREEALKFDFATAAQVRDLRQLETIGLVMKETLRLHPPLIMVARKLEKDFDVDGYNIPKGTAINLVFHCTQRDDRVWSHPLQFDPSRFSSERREELKCPYAYAPFGAGQHHCIGFQFAEMQIKLVISELVKRFKLSVPEGYDCPIADVPLKHPKDGLPIYVDNY